ncbi:unnamed protein product [Prunus brigantina]
MSSPYPILDNRPIDQWKVTELKEELKKRKLTTKGLKDDLIKRLDEAIRIERANNGLNGDPQPVVGVKVVEPRSGSRTPKSIGSGGRKRTEKVDVPVQIDNRPATLDQGNIQEGYILVDKDACAIVEEELGQSTTVETTVETSVTVTESVVTEEVVIVQDSQSTEANKGNGNSKPLLENEDAKPLLENEDPKLRLENEDPKPQLENEDPKPQLENEEPEPQLENEALKPQLEIEDLKPQLENEGLEPIAKDDMLGSSAPNYQVSEVSTLGSEVKYDSISTDSVSINETIELKDNIIADHVKLELDIVKPEMVYPSSSTVVPVSGDSHPMDVDEPLEDKASLGEKDDNITNADISKKNDNADLGYSEILNLERSSGDDSMEEDVLDSKQIDSKYSSDDVGDIGEKNEVPIVNEKNRAGIVGDDIATDKNDVSVENKNHPALPAEKRKLNDQAAVGSNEPVKRRRWNSENLKVPELQSPLQTPSVTPKDTFQTPSLKRSFSRSNSTMSEDAPKERVVPPSPKPPTNSLRIDRFLRPFTLKAVQELLGKTGKVTDFWMDHIKTHCYVTYSSAEEALETRNAVYNLQWPPNGGRLLVAEFVDPQEVQTRVQIPQTPATPISSGPAVPVAPSTSQPQPSPRQPRQQQQQLPPPPSLPPPPPPPLTAPSSARERLPLPPPPPLPEKLDTPIVTLDDLFRKTKSTPRIYYLPLSEEQVAEKLSAQGKNAKQ